MLSDLRAGQAGKHGGICHRKVVIPLPKGSWVSKIIGHQLQQATSITEAIESQHTNFAVIIETKKYAN